LERQYPYDIGLDYRDYRDVQALGGVDALGAFFEHLSYNTSVRRIFREKNTSHINQTNRSYVAAQAECVPVLRKRMKPGKFGGSGAFRTAAEFWDALRKTAGPPMYGVTGLNEAFYIDKTTRSRLIADENLFLGKLAVLNGGQADRRALDWLKRPGDDFTGIVERSSAAALSTGGETRVGGTRKPHAKRNHPIACGAA
jgi:hypothetical protein